MKTIRTILATFGVTTLLYGLFALIAMRLDLTFTGRSIYQLFRSTGFAALVLGVGCILSFIIMTIALVSFREDKSKKRDFFEDEDDDDFIDEETVPAARADEADEAWSPEIKRKQRKALFATDEQEEPEIPDLFEEDDAEEQPIIAIRTAEEPEQEEPEQEEPEAEPDLEEPEAEPESKDTEGKKQCVFCGEWIDADSAFCIKCGRRV